jgi:non-specific serine/threonine protein kinase
VGACAETAETLLRACPGVRVLATSREALGVAGEARYRVPSLPAPGRSALVTWEELTQYAAVRLFIDRAVSVRAEFAVTHENAPAVAQICQRLDGIPLAIELAAARVTALPVETIHERLDDRFRLLTGGYSRTALPRQQTLRALIDWSYDLLTEPERMLLRRLSVFAGGWTLDAAEAVCSVQGLEAEDVLDLLTHLVGKSLVSYEEQGEKARYRLLETVRQYGRDRLREGGEVEIVGERHRDWNLELVERAGSELSGEHQAEWLERLEAEHDNLRAALEWSAERGEAPESLRLAGGLTGYWSMRGYVTEGRQRLDAALAMEGAEEPTPARAAALRGAGFLAWRQGDYEAARGRVEECLMIARALSDGLIASDALATLAQIAYAQSDYEAACSLTEERLAICRQLGDWERIAFSLTGLAIWVKFQGDLTRAWALCEESLAISREWADTRGIARKTLHELGSVAVCQGDFAGAQPFLEESLALHRKAGDRGDASWSLHYLGDVAFYQGEFARARALYEESLALRREIGDQLAISFSLCRLGHVALAEGDPAGASVLLGECLAIRKSLGNQRGLAECLEGFARVGRARGQWQRAARQLGTAEALRETIKTPLWPCERREHEDLVAAVRAALGEEALAAAWAEGRTMPLQQAIEEALCRSDSQPPGQNPARLSTTFSSGSPAT